jgi:hypothetical protein
LEALPFINWGGARRINVMWMADVWWGQILTTSSCQLKHSTIFKTIYLSSFKPQKQDPEKSMVFLGQTQRSGRYQRNHYLNDYQYAYLTQGSIMNN